MAGLLLSGLSRRHDSALYLSDLDRRCLVSSAIATELHDGFFRIGQQMLMKTLQPQFDV
ncbi:hypothetical protein ZOSMA_99G00060 [Zostera marina]|uniref:Uncharacterized protein n=1 Tax=Zostera marina TaxID=29655 RepID=A0A0K9NH35_ZOSMR|nr:hypothetical protein ZOSMA_99G00060 [Zostera marina]